MALDFDALVASAAARWTAYRVHAPVNYPRCWAGGQTAYAEAIREAVPWTRVRQWLAEEERLVVSASPPIGCHKELYVDHCLRRGSVPSL